MVNSKSGEMEDLDLIDEFWPNLKVGAFHDDCLRKKDRADEKVTELVPGLSV